MQDIKLLVLIFNFTFGHDPPLNNQPVILRKSHYKRYNYAAISYKFPKVNHHDYVNLEIRLDES